MEKTEAKIVAPSDFRNSVALTEGKVKRAFARNGKIYVATSQPRGFAVIDTEGSGQVAVHFEERRLLGGMFSGDGDTIFAPLQNKLMRLDAKSSTEVLPPGQDSIFGVKEVALVDAYLIVVSHNGLYVFERDGMELLASFENEGKSVSPINFCFDKGQNTLYIANLRDEVDRNSILLAANAADGFAVRWKQRMNGQLSASAGEAAVSRLLLAGGQLVCPVQDTVSKQWIELRDPATGDVVNSLPVHSNRLLGTDGKLIYIGEYTPNTAAALQASKADIVWTAELSAGLKGPFRVINDKLHLYGPGKQTTAIDRSTGKIEVLATAPNFEQVFGEDLRLSEKYYIVDRKWLCWD